MKSSIIRASKGEERLWIVFWLYNVLGLLLFAFLLKFLQAVGISAEKNGHSDIGILVLISVLTIVFIAYIVWAVGSLWRCAFNVEWKWWGYLGRAYVLWFIFSLIAIMVSQLFH